MLELDLIEDISKNLGITRGEKRRGPRFKCI